MKYAYYSFVYLYHSVNPFLANLLISCPLKTTESLIFGCFKG